MGGAKNHAIVLPDADLDQAVADIMGAAYGSAGERCMALPVAVPVGDKTADALRERLLDQIETLKVGVSSDPAAQYGPVVTAAHRKRITDYIQMGVDEGAELVVDGRDFALQGYRERLLHRPHACSTTSGRSMRTYKDEIFGPVLQLVRAESFEEAVALPSKHQYGNGVAIFTRNGRAAREFAARVEVGMVGINVPIPVPVAYHTFGGWKRSAFGDANQHGMEGVRFYTKVKTVTARWPEGAARRLRLRHPDDAMSAGRRSCCMAAFARLADGRLRARSDPALVGRGRVRWRPHRPSTSTRRRSPALPQAAGWVAPARRREQALRRRRRDCSAASGSSERTLRRCRRPASTSA